MLAFIGGTYFGCVIGVFIMCLLQINRDNKHDE